MSSKDINETMRLHREVKAKLDVTGASGSKRSIFVRSKMFALILPLLLPFVRSALIKNLNKVVSWVSSMVGTALVSIGVTNDQLSAYGTSHEQIIGGAVALAVGVVCVALEWGASYLSLRVNPPPKAVAVDEKV